MSNIFRSAGQRLYRWRNQNRELLWNCGDYTFELACEPVIMGILNLTPDSFSDGGSYNDDEAACEHAHAMIEQGAHIIDVGGESTRPGATELDFHQEWQRVAKVVQNLASDGICVSIDTRHEPVAKSCLEAGASIINDICGLSNHKMLMLTARSPKRPGVVIMHMQGRPETMQKNPQYTDVVKELEAFFGRSLSRAGMAGIAKERICLDPGIGFGKSWRHNQELLCATRQLCAFGAPLMCAISRKSYIAEMTDIKEPCERDEASALCAAVLAAFGARVIRTHNVGLTKRALKDSRRVFIALGSNKDDPIQQLNDACNALKHVPHSFVFAISHYYESEPAYQQEQAPFINAVVLLQTMLDPYELLDECHAIENSQKRVRDELNGPRTLDLDIIDYEGVTSDDEHLILPHPRALERDFVVTPLLELDNQAHLADGRLVSRSRVSCGHIIKAL